MRRIHAFWFSTVCSSWWQSLILGLNLFRRIKIIPADHIKLILQLSANERILIPILSIFGIKRAIFARIVQLVIPPLFELRCDSNLVIFIIRLRGVLVDAEKTGAALCQDYFLRRGSAAVHWAAHETLAPAAFHWAHVLITFFPHCLKVRFLASSRDNRSLPFQLVHLLSFPHINWGQMIDNNILLPVIYGSVPLSFLIRIIHILDVHARVVLEITDCELLEFFSEGLLLIG